MKPQVTPENMGMLLTEIASQAEAIEALCTEQIVNSEGNLATATAIRSMASIIGYLADHGGANTRSAAGQDRAGPWLLPVALREDPAAQH
jgi:hypothetical protein